VLGAKEKAEKVANKAWNEGGRLELTEKSTEGINGNRPNFNVEQIGKTGLGGTAGHVVEPDNVQRKLAKNGIPFRHPHSSP
jgi:hypothetical protein